MNFNIHNQIKMEYDKRIKTANEDLLERTNEVYARFPRIKDIDYEIKINGIHYNKMILKEMLSPSDALPSLTTKINALKLERQEILLSEGYSKSHLDITYRCNTCKDTGEILVDGFTKNCICYKQQLINHLYNESNLRLTENDSFNSFKEEYYSNSANEEKYGIKASPRQNILNIKERCLKFIENFSDSDEKNLFFSGPTGVGKTFLSNCIASELLGHGHTVLYQTSPTLFDIVNEHKFRSFGQGAHDNLKYKNILEAELLIIDDLGTEPPSAARFADLLTILNTRHLANLKKPCKTIISTNIEARELYDYYSERVASRIIGDFEMFKLAGEDIRRLKKSLK